MGPTFPSDAFSRSLLARGIAAVVGLKIAGIVLAFDPTRKLLDAFDLPTAEWSRMTEWLLAALLLLSVARFGPAIMPRTKILLLPVVLLSVYAIAAIFAEDRYLAFFGAQGRYLGLTWATD